MPAADREHRHEPRGGRGGGADRGVAALARDRVGRRDPVPARRRRALPGRGGTARRRGQGVRGRRRDPDPDAERGRDRLGRRDQGAHRVPGGRARGHGHPPLRRPTRLQLRVAGRRLGRRDHARDPRRRPRLQHAQADRRARGARRRAADLRPRAQHLRRRRQEALQAARRAVDRGVPGRGLHRAGADELPGAARLGARRRDHDHVARRAGRAVHARARGREPGHLRLREARLDERPVPARARRRCLRGRARHLPARAGDRLGRGADPGGGSDRAGEDGPPRRVPGLRTLPVRGRRARPGPARRGDPDRAPQTSSSRSSRGMRRTSRRP